MVIPSLAMRFLLGMAGAVGSLKSHEGVPNFPAKTEGMAGGEAMKLRVGDLFAQCPYCGGDEFLSPEGENRELVCANCDGHASRQVILERLGDAAAARARESLVRLKEQRRSKKTDQRRRK
jgi:hypothetical protein